MYTLNTWACYGCPIVTITIFSFCRPLPLLFVKLTFVWQCLLLMSDFWLQLSYSLSLFNLLPCYHVTRTANLTFLQPCSRSGSLPLHFGQSNTLLLRVLPQSYIFLDLENHASRDCSRQPYRSGRSSWSRDVDLGEVDWRFSRSSFDSLFSCSTTC